MTVGELIDELLRFNPSAVVKTPVEDEFRESRGEKYLAHIEGAQMNGKGVVVLYQEE